LPHAFDTGRGLPAYHEGGALQRRPRCAEKVARGAAEIAVTLISEIVSVKGTRSAAALPTALQLYTVSAAAIPASSTDPAAAHACIAALTGPAMAQRRKAAGFEPPK
jgi:ABC-type molybdate transport system substrate-binding protein